VSEPPYNEERPTKAIGYVRASTAEQRQSGLGLQAQRTAIEAACTQRGWRLLRVEEDIASGAKADRPGLKRALDAVESGEADCIVVLRLDRLSRSVADFARMLQRLPRGLVCLDLGIDPSTPAGEMTATVVAAMAQLERRLIGERTKEALAQKRAQGVRLGRPREISQETIDRISELHEAGLSVAAIARRLNEESVPTPRGGRWHSPGVKRALSWVRA
jgi:DNA invertase Pin-like site-specific DNA recombinase